MSDPGKQPLSMHVPLAFDVPMSKVALEHAVRRVLRELNRAGHDYSDFDFEMSPDHYVGGWLLRLTCIGVPNDPSA